MTNSIVKLRQTFNTSSLIPPEIAGMLEETSRFQNMVNPEIKGMIEQASRFQNMVNPEIKGMIEEASRFQNMVNPEIKGMIEEASRFQNMVNPEIKGMIEEASRFQNMVNPEIKGMIEQASHFQNIITSQTSTLVQTLNTSSLIASAIDASTLTQALNVSHSIFEIVQPAIRWQEEWSNSVVELCSNLNSVTRRLTADFAAIDLSLFSLPLDKIFRDLIRIHKEQKETAEAFKAAGWPIAPSMSSELREQVISLHKQGKTRYISNAIMGYYRRRNYENLRNMVNSWRGHPLFDSRIKIIDDALSAHCEKKYTLSIPALFPLIEGTLNDYVIRNNLPVKCGKIKKVYEAVIGDPGDYSLATWAIAHTLLFQLKNSTYAYTSFDKELKKSRKSRCISRHTVLHGVSTNYHKPSWSLKILVLLDAISALTDVYPEV